MFEDGSSKDPNQLTAYTVRNYKEALDIVKCVFAGDMACLFWFGFVFLF